MMSLPFVKNPRKIYKKILIIVIDYRCVQPVATGSGTHDKLFSRSNTFLLLKGPGSFKTIFKIGGNVDEFKAYRFIPFTSPLLFHFTLPLSKA
jgi:hypothetical protein